MNIAEIWGKCKRVMEAIPRDALIVAILIAASALSFGLGYLAGLDARAAAPLTIELPNDPDEDQNIVRRRVGERVVASKNGTKYYVPSCAGASRISEANKVWFATAAAAQAAGYSPAANCN